MRRDVRVALAGRPYDVAIGRGTLEESAAGMAAMLRRPVAAVVMDETVRDLHLARLAAALGAQRIEVRPVAISPGEEAKSFAGLESLLDRLLALELERGDILFAFGGGVVGDLTGFAAAIYMRGIDFIQIPTTLLAQVDSSVGGKTAIDTPRGKNLVGAFHQPRMVVADLSLLDTLPDREMRCGFAEIVKCGLLGDAAFFAWLEENGAAVLARREQALAHAVARSVEVKAAIVAQDEREGGARALLNLGHTFAHALEAETGYGEALKHGEAVALGCVLAFRLSHTLGLCTAAEADRVRQFVAASSLPSTLSDLAAPVSASAILGRMSLDKKAQGGGLTFVLARGIGGAFVAPDVDRAAVREVLLAEGARP
ncbi:MAG TPA: 3-dehydroquinate synthase [Caulobacteraceae bacterium]|nr:3-dehydroquinate synthase [Caulobacteraceae bacterium]